METIWKFSYETPNTNTLRKTNLLTFLEDIKRNQNDLDNQIIHVYNSTNKIIICSR